MWVHNKDCWVDIPNNARQKQVGNNTVYEFDDNGRTVQVIKNPDWKQGDKKAQYIEVETTNGQISVKHEDRTDINYSYDVNGNKVVKDENNQYFANDPNNPKVDTGYHRPYLRSDTMEAIMKNYKKLPNGDYEHIETGKTIKGPIDIGHVAGFEHRRLEIVAEELKMTQAEFNEYVNARSNKFQLENRSVNRSHIDEMSGKDIPPTLRKDMTEFLNQLRGVKK
ncbi:HNH/ENDO VII family nuclease [Moraxella sp. Tifton1]|nr:HNH/ENDO VII family nuclease [Moraxella sp. Tifton1]